MARHILMDKTVNQIVGGPLAAVTQQSLKNGDRVVTLAFGSNGMVQLLQVKSGFKVVIVTGAARFHFSGTLRSQKQLVVTVENFVKELNEKACNQNH